MQIAQNILNKPFVKIGLLLGVAFVMAQYLFYFGGKSVIQNSNFDSAIQLLTIIGLYFGVQHCQKRFPEARFWQLFFYGLLIISIAIFLKTLFSILLYGFFAPELGVAYKEELMEQMEVVTQNLNSLPKVHYKELTQAMLNSVTIPIMEGIVLLVYGIIFSTFISTLLNMFRK